MTDCIFDNPLLADECRRWIEKAGKDHYARSDMIGVHDVMRAHYSILNYFDFSKGEGVAGTGPRDLNLLHSAVSRQDVGFGGVTKYTDRFDLLATLFYGLIQNHPFHDANKRTALLVLLLHLQKIGRTPIVGDRDLEALARRTAAHLLGEYPQYGRFSVTQDPDVSFLSFYLRRNTRELQSRERTVTFKQLDTILRRFHFELGNPAGNFIDILKCEERGFLRKKIEKKFICQVGFPSWKAQVDLQALRKIRRDTHLTSQDGYDTQAFFEGADPLPSLVAKYHNPLRRLARK